MKTAETDSEREAQEWVSDFFAFDESKFTNEQWKSLKANVEYHLEEMNRRAVKSPSRMSRIEAFRKHPKLSASELAALRLERINFLGPAVLQNEYGLLSNFHAKIAPMTMKEARELLSLGEYPPNSDKLFLFTDLLLYLLTTGALMKAFKKVGFTTVKKYYEYELERERYSNINHRIREELLQKYQQETKENWGLSPELLYKNAPQLLTSNQLREIKEAEEFKRKNELNAENFLRKLLLILVDGGLGCYPLTG